MINVEAVIMCVYVNLLCFKLVRVCVFRRIIKYRISDEANYFVILL